MFQERYEKRDDVRLGYAIRLIAKPLLKPYATTAAEYHDRLGQAQYLVLYLASARENLHEGTKRVPHMIDHCGL